MTDCSDGAVRDLLPDLVHDRLEPDVRRRVDAHVLGCSDCQQEVELLVALRKSLRRGPVMDVGAIASAIPAYRASRRSWGGWRAAAAVVLLAVGGTSVAVLQRERDTGRDSAISTVVPVVRGAAPMAQATPAPLPLAIDEPSRELVIGNPAIDELDDRELSTLLAGLETIEALPSPDEDRPADLQVRAPAGTD